MEEMLLMNSRIKVNLGEATFWIMVLICAILFAGTPDIAGAIIYKLTDGKYQLPPHKEEK